MMEVEMYIPHNITDIKGNEQRVAEVVAKLVNKLKEGPLKHGKTDQEWLDGAIKFLVTDEGEAWSKWKSMGSRQSYIKCLQKNSSILVPAANSSNRQRFQFDHYCFRKSIHCRCGESQGDDKRSPT
jgi:hypothetical protein